MKNAPDHEDEIHDVVGFKDSAQNVVTAVMQISPALATELVSRVKSIVRAAHDDPKQIFFQPDEDGITRAQKFEEGDVFMLEKPFDGYPSDRYIMDFYDVNERGVCSRMHLHTGTRFVRIMTGAGTNLRISSFSPMILSAASEFTLFQEVDEMPGMPEGHKRDRYSVIVPPNSIVDMQIPAGVSHQFNADGPNAVIDSVHPEESVEIFREKMNRPNMMAQTIFLTPDKPRSGECVIPYIDKFVRPQASQPRDFSRREWLGLAAALAGSAILSTTSLSAILRSDMENFKRANPSAIEVKFITSPESQINIADAYGGAHEVVNPQSILLPRDIYDLVTTKSELLQDADYAGWVANKITLRKTNGINDPEQRLFDYVVIGESKTQTKTVTPANLQDAIADLKAKFNKQHQSPDLSKATAIRT